MYRKDFLHSQKKDIIGILDDFSGITEKFMIISVCDKEKIKWITDEEIEVHGERLPIINEAIRFENGMTVN